eukprot:COSAG01_NODE_9790_length_2343_cov_1.459002_2_plen_190_part_00
MRDESDTTIFWELESLTSNTPLSGYGLSISSKVYMPPGDVSLAACQAINSTFDVNGKAANAAKCAAASCGALCKMEFCKTGDLSGKFGPVSVGAKGSPARVRRLCSPANSRTDGLFSLSHHSLWSVTSVAAVCCCAAAQRFVVDRFWRSGDPLSATSAKQGGCKWTCLLDARSSFSQPLHHAQMCPRDA